MAMSAVYVLGVGLSHDGSACLLKDGRVAVAIEKERLTGRKHDGLNDTQCVQYCLDAAGIRPIDVSVIVQNANFSMFEAGNDWFFGPRALPEGIPVVTISHHLAHAYSAVGTSPFQETSVLVIDGCGNAFDETLDRDGALILCSPRSGEEHLFFEKDSYYFFDGKTLHSLMKDFSPWGLGIRQYPMCPPTTMHSIGGVYAAVSAYSLFGMDDPGKLMGLSPYGRPGVHSFEIFELTEGRVFVKYDWMKRFTRPNRHVDDFKHRFQEHADLAYWVQREVERALLYVVRSRHAFAPSANLSYAGGVALNAVANHRIRTEGPFRDFYVQPAAGDNGLALGCAFYGWMQVLGRPKVEPEPSTFFGRYYSREKATRAIKAAGPDLSVEATDDVIHRTAEMLSSGAVVGWFQAGSEFGPRALGHRSILADPRSDTVQARINRTVKFREDFRPFAPSVPLEDLPRFFQSTRESPYMLEVVAVREEHRPSMPAVVHVDGSCRVQTIRESVDPRYHRLHREFERLSGIPVLLNTSLNSKGQPIIETPEAAVEFLRTTGLDALVIDDLLITKRRVYETVSVRPSKPAADFIGVYPEVISAEDCRIIIGEFERSGEAEPGRTGSGVDRAIKHSVDITLGEKWRPIEKRIVRAALTGLVNYVRAYPETIAGSLSISVPDDTGAMRPLTGELITQSSEKQLVALVTRLLRPGSVNLQKYPAGVGGYHRWHSEIYPLDANCETLHRALFFIIFLNSVPHGGETEFLFQKSKIVPRPGTLLIAPAGFTHTHRGNMPVGGDKYIATSWFLFQRADKLYGR